jgi:arylsulfatase A-like enzyme
MGAGAIDALGSWQASSQFVAGFADRLRVVAFCVCAYGLAGAIAGLSLMAALSLLLNGSRLGELVGSAVDMHEQRRAKDAGDAVAGLAMVIAGLPTFVIASSIAHKLSLPLLSRRNPDLVVALIMMGMLGALAITAAVTLLLARQFERVLAVVARRRPFRWISSGRAPAVAFLLLLTVFGAALLRREWETVRQLPLRLALAIIGVAGLAVASGPLAQRLLRKVLPMPRWQRGLLAALLLAVTLAGVMGFGASTSTIKAATTYSGLAGPIASAIRKALDRDRDGYSPLLGGGDCDDGDARVHPGAPEVPDDGIDQNCVAGDVSARAVPRELGFVAVPPAVSRNANILLITIDTLRADHLSAYGYERPTSPSIDAVAAEGTLFEHSWAHAPSTRYSIPAILTGRLPLEVEYDTSVEGWPGLAPSATTIAEVLRPQGYVGGAITNYWYFDRRRGMDQGFDEYDNENARLHSSVPGAGPAETQGSSAREQTDKAIAFVERHAARPWFLWVHYYDPHYGYEAHAGGVSFGSGRIDLYDGEIRFTDDQIGRLLASLKERGDYDRTIIAITGDHGEGFGEHGIELHGYHLYAAQTRVPMIIRVPGLPARRSSTPIGHIDLLPTLANLAGGKSTDATLASAMGRSMVDVLSGAPDRDREIWQQLSYEGNHEMRGAANRTCHVIYNVSPSSSWEVYRIDRDPMETKDLASTSECRATRRALERWVDAEQLPAGAAESLLSGRPELPATVDVDLGDAVRLLAVTVSPRASAGETVEVTWTFEARGAPPLGWSVFAHVEGPTRFSGDHVPARPLEWWKAGQFVRYSTRLVIPRGAPPGVYTMWSGLWKGSKRMPARSSKVKIEQDRAAVATIEILP